MDKKQILSQCVQEAIEIGRSHMYNHIGKDPRPTKEEWALVLVLFKQRLEELYSIKFKMGVN